MEGYVVHDLQDKLESSMLRRNEPELRTFEQKLIDYYVQKERLCQIKEKEHRRLAEKILENRQSLIVNQISAAKEESELERQVTTRTERQRNARGLRMQMELRDLRRIYSKYEHLRQQELDEQVLADVEKEKLRKLKEKYEGKEAMHDEMVMTQKIKQLQLRTDKLLLEENEKKMDVYNKQREARAQEIAKINASKKKTKEEIYDIIASKMWEKQKADEERAILIKELRDHEYLLESEIRQNKSNTTFKEDIIKILKMQIESNKLRQKRLMEEELLYRNQLLQNLKKEDEHSHEMEIQEKLINLKYRYEIDKQIENNKKIHQNKQEMIRIADEYVKKYNEKKKQQIELEKQRLLNEYGVQNLPNN